MEHRAEEIDGFTVERLAEVYLSVAAQLLDRSHLRGVQHPYFHAVQGVRSMLEADRVRADRQAVDHVVLLQLETDCTRSAAQVAERIGHGWSAQLVAGSLIRLARDGKARRIAPRSDSERPSCSTWARPATTTNRPQLGPQEEGDMPKLTTKTTDKTKAERQAAEAERQAKWRAEGLARDAALTLHPLCTIFPDLEERDPEGWARLLADVEQNGVELDGVLWDDGEGNGLQILDGRNRWKASQKAERPMPWRVFEGTHDEARSLVLSLNVNRRHLTPETSANLLVELAMDLADQADKRKADGAKAGGKARAEGAASKGPRDRSKGSGKQTAARQLRDTAKEAGLDLSEDQAAELLREVRKARGVRPNGKPSQADIKAAMKRAEEVSKAKAEAKRQARAKAKAEKAAKAEAEAKRRAQLAKAGGEEEKPGLIPNFPIKATPPTKLGQVDKLSAKAARAKVKALLGEVKHLETDNAQLMDRLDKTQAKLAEVIDGPQLSKAETKALSKLTKADLGALVKRLEAERDEAIKERDRSRETAKGNAEEVHRVAAENVQLAQGKAPSWPALGSRKARGSGVGVFSEEAEGIERHLLKLIEACRTKPAGLTGKERQAVAGLKPTDRAWGAIVAYAMASPVVAYGKGKAGRMIFRHA
jgi:hypothetical protein